MTTTPARIASTLLAIVAAVVLSATAAQGQATAGEQIWERSSLTVHVADPAAWSGTDVAAALGQWAPAMPMTLTDDRGADIVLTSEAARPMVGATAYTDGEGARLTSCRVALSADYAGKPMVDVLTHELGHCLGLGHSHGGEASVMYWIGGGEHFSETVTPADVAALRALYR